MRFKIEKFFLMVIFLLAIAFPISAFGFENAPASEINNIYVNNSLINHNDLENIQGGSATERYHLTQALYDLVVANAADWITNSVNDLVNYYTKTDINNAYVPYSGSTQNVQIGNNNFSVNASTFFVDSNNGRVGIGTINPTEKLHISGGVATYDSDRNLTSLYQLADKKYVDKAVTALGARYYMIDNASGEADYKLCSISPSAGSEQSISKTDLLDDDYIIGWISPNIGEPDKLITGVYNWRIYAEKTDGIKTLKFYWKLVERKNDNSETVIGTSIVSNEITSDKASYIIPLTLSEDYDIANDSYVVGKIYADVSGGGTAPDVNLYYEGDSDSHWQIPVNTEILNDIYVNIDGDTMTGALNLPANGLVAGTNQLVLSGGNVGIGTTSPSYPLEVRGNTTASNITIWAEGNISATGFITRTSIFDKSKGNALDLIHNSDYYLDKNGKIDHKKFYGYAGEFEVTDYSRPVKEEYIAEECNETTGKCLNITKIRTTYPYTKMEEGVELGREIDVLRQAIYELKIENNELKKDLCSLGITRWC